MRLSASIYVDNQAEIGYPVAWLVQRFPASVKRIYIFASDDSNLSSVLQGISDPRVVSEPIGVHIREPVDIAKAQNECLRRVDRQTFDAHLLVQADIWVLPATYAHIETLLPCPNGAPQIFSVQHVRLHTSTYSSVYGVTVLFPDTPADQATWDEQTSDGAYPKGYTTYTVHDSSLALDIGWHCAEAIARHLRVHARTWKSNEQADLVQLYDTNRREFMLRYFDFVRRSMIANPQPMPLDGPYGEVVETMELRIEYDTACTLLQESA